MADLTQQIENDMNALTSPLPANAYEIIHARLQELGLATVHWNTALSERAYYPYIAELAHANGRPYAQGFEPYFRSTSAALQQSLTQFADLQTTYPQLRFIASGYNKMPAIQQVSGVKLAMKQEHLEKTFRFIDRLETAIPEILNNSTIGTLAGKITTPIELRQGAFLADNMSQYQRRLQESHAQLAIPRLREFIAIMDKLCAERNATFSLRPLLAFPSTMHDQIRGINPAHGIQSLFSYLSPSQAMVHQALENLNLHKQLFKHRPRDKTSFGEEPHLHTFWLWTRITASAMITFNDSGDNGVMALTPDGIPPFLFRVPNVTLPLYSAKHIQTPLVHDQVSRTLLLDNHEVENFDESTLIRLQSHMDGEDWVYMGRLMALIATMTSLIVTTLNMGKGHRKPQWTQSPINAQLIRFMYRYEEYMLHEGKKYGV